MAVAVMTAAVAAMVFFLVPDRPNAGRRESPAELVAGLRPVFSNGLFLSLSLLFACVQGTYLAVQGLWSALWLRDIAGQSRDEVGQTLLWLAVTMTLGFALVGSLSDWLSRRGIESVAVLKAGIGVSIAMFALLAAGVKTGAAWIWMAYAFSSTTGTVLVYTILSKAFSTQLTGRVNTASNLLLFVFAFAAQWGIGAVINLWTAVDGRYPPAAYHVAFGIPLLLQCAAYAVMLRGTAR
jgi:predicted MFS family arabinose efflux permease